MEGKIIILLPGLPHCVFIASKIKDVNRNKMPLGTNAHKLCRVEEFVEIEAAIAGCVPSAYLLPCCNSHGE